MKNIVIINAYGDKNIGDAAILKVALKFITNAIEGEKQIKVLCENTAAISDFISTNKKIKAYQLPYGYAIRSRKGKISKFIKAVRLIEIVSVSAFYTIVDSLGIRSKKKGFYSYIDVIKNADVVIGMGGGYFLTKQKISDTFGLVLSILPVYIAKRFNKKILFLPISIGPFASKLHSALTFMTLRNTTVICRDEITLRLVSKNNKSNKINSFFRPDLALFYDWINDKKETKSKSDYIVVTAREWLEENEQKEYEQSLSQFIDKQWSEHRLRTIFIPMARNAIEDDDNIVAERIKDKLSNKDCFSVVSPKSIDHLQEILEKARAAVCTRMHSAILSTTTKTPFIAIGYGHKTKGYMKFLDLEKWLIDITEVDTRRINSMFDELIEKENYSSFIKRIEKKREEIDIYRSRVFSDIKSFANYAI